MQPPPYPTELAGLDSFSGRVLRADAVDEDTALGQRVALIGTGARAVWLLPRLAASAQKVTVFQRSPRWILRSWPFGRQHPLSPAPEAYIGTPLLRRLAAYQARAHLKRAVPERWLRRQLTPQGPFGGQPVLISAQWYALLQQPQVKLITWPIVRLSADGIRSVEGIEHQVDTVILATGAPRRAAPHTLSAQELACPT